MKTRNRSLTLRTLGYYWRQVRAYKPLLTINILSSGTAVVLGNIVVSYLVADLIEQLSKYGHGVDQGDLFQILWLLVAVRVTEMSLWRINDYISGYRIAKTLRNLEQFVFGKLQQQSYRFYADNFAGSLVAQENRFVTSYQNLESLIGFDLLFALIKIVFSVIVLFFIAPLLGISLLVWVILFITSVVFLTIKKSGITRAAAEADTRVTASLADVITNIVNVKSFARNSYEQERFNRISQERFHKRWRSFLYDSHIRTYRWILLLGFYFLFVYLSIYSVVHGLASLTAIIAAQLYLLSIYNDMFSLNQTIQRIEQSLSDAAELTEVLGIIPTVQDPELSEKANIQDGLIVFQDVSFQYEDDGNEIFSDFNLRVNPGEKIGLVGHSGSGKSTLTRLLLRFADLRAGVITIDNQDISKMTQDDLRSHIAFVPQEPILFHRSLMENIRYGNPSSSDAEVKRVARLAHAAEFIEALPDKYETPVGERGIKLSGGEKQRIAIARAMLSNAPILLLDEATSALDSKSEKLITSALDRLMKNRTTIVVAHRLSTIRKMDRILVMKRGSIIEDGTHESLLAKHGTYAELWAHQSGGFLDE